MSKIACDHCHLEFDDSVMIKDGTHNFCCKGCQGVFHLLQESGFGSFYDKLGKRKLAAPTSSFSPSREFDSKAFYEQFVTTNSDGFCEVSLIIGHIHCSACVWLNEKALFDLDGVIDVHINYTNSKARLVYDSDVIKLSQIVDMIRAIGYDASAYNRQTLEDRAMSERREYYLRIVVALVALMNMMIISTAQYSGLFSGMGQNVRTILNFGGWFLATPVLFYSGWTFFRGSYYALKRESINMDILVATGATLTYLYSIYLTLFTDKESYFDSVVMIITFILIGKFLEVLSRKSVADTLDVISVHAPTEAIIVDNGVTRSVSVNDVKVEDILLLRAGERVGVDGVIVSGEGNFDESSLTGESDPIYKKVESRVISGTVNIDGTVHYRATKEFRHSTLSLILDLLDRSLAKKPRLEQLANRLSEHFSTAILLLSLLTFAAWWFYAQDFETAFMIGISVIIIACPCALALATPVATLIGVGEGAKRGILFKEASLLETLAQVDTVVLDKTGTLTHGRPEVVNANYSDTYSEETRLKLLALLASSKHPVSVGVREFVEKNGDKPKELQSVKQVASRGVVAKDGSDALVGGSAEFMRESGVEVIHEVSLTQFYFAINGTIVATFELEDGVKDGSIDAVCAMKQMGLKVIMLTGDNISVATAVAKKVGIDEFSAHLSAEQKAQKIVSLQESGSKIVMAGDGVNDILALATADIGISMGSGSDIAISVSDVVLMNSKLTSLSDSIKLSRETFRLIKQNLALSLLYNMLTIPLAMAGFIIPLVAAISMSLSSLLVVTNSMRLKRVKYG